MHLCSRRSGMRSLVMMVCAALLSLQSAIADAGSVVRILAHEPFQPIVESSAVQKKSGTGSARQLKFDAFGRRFALTLEENARLGALIPASEGPALTLYRGSIDGVPASWARLSAQAQQVRGLIWDGNELYVVDSAAALGNATNDQATDTIIFRLSDTQIEPGAKFCDADSGSARTAFTAMLKELKQSSAIMRAPGASLRLELSIIGDALLRARYASDQQALDAILIRLNNVDGIYTSQLGVELQATTVDLNDAIASQLPASTDANALVADLSSLRARTPALNVRGLTHLFTGRDLDGDTVGTAYIGGLCSKTYGAGLTQVSGSIGIDSLIAAHEIGHNFGAIHDGENRNGLDCSATPVNQFIMSPQVAQGATSFSQCSLDAIRPVIQAASCLMPMTAPDLAIDTDLGTQTVAASTPFDWLLTVSNRGGSTAANSRITILVPPVVTVDEAWVAGGTCTSGAGVISCAMGDIAAAGSRVVHLTLRSDVVGSNSVSAHVTAASDDDSSNDAGDGTLVIAPSIDLAVSLSSGPSLTVGSTQTLTYAAQNLSATDASAVVIDLSVTGGLNVVASGSENCALGDGKRVKCTLPLVSAGQSVTGSLTLGGTAAGVATVQATISGDVVDPQAANDSASQSITITQPSVAHSSAAGGGGGALEIGLLFSLAGLIGIRRRAAQPHSQVA